MSKSSNKRLGLLYLALSPFSPGSAVIICMLFQEAIRTPGFEDKTRPTSHWLLLGLGFFACFQGIVSIPSISPPEALSAALWPGARQILSKPLRNSSAVCTTWHMLDGPLETSRGGHVETRCAMRGRWCASHSQRMNVDVTVTTKRRSPEAEGN